MTEVRALVWTGGPRFEQRCFPLPELTPGELLVRVRTAAICGSDRHTVEGRRDAPCPGVLGHEGVGEVVAVGPTTPGLSAPRDLDGALVLPGDRVVWSVVSACRDCDRCIAGHGAKCRRLRKAGHEGLDSTWPLSGSYASHVVLPAGHPVVHVPAEVADGPAAIAACAGATVMASLAAAPAPLRGLRVLVSGVGMLGLLAIAAARAEGAAEIHAIDPSAARRALAREAGASGVSAPSADVSGLRGTADLALEFSGASGGVAAAIEALDVGGTAVLAGSVFPGSGVLLDPEQLVRGRRTVTGVHNYEPPHLSRAIALLATTAGRSLPWQELLGSPIALEAVPEAFTTPSAHLRTLVEP